MEKVTKRAAQGRDGAIAVAPLKKDDDMVKKKPSLTSVSYQSERR